MPGSGVGREAERTIGLYREQGWLLFVGYTMRGPRTRIIIACKAELYERWRYREENRKA